ncbi:MAG TPA: pyridoxal-phosphate dependent enzyme [Spirochaetia bacterium]|nr:pyridoxal-phosphate dependent enzyme [Spirochaetia bacterium]
MISLDVHPDVRGRNVRRCREKGIILPTFAQMKAPETAPRRALEGLKSTGLWDVNPLNLFRITWRNEPVESGGTFGGVNFLEFPSSLTGVPARIIALVGKWFPTGAHKVGATYGCLAPALVTGSFDSTKQKAAWPSTGNYCRGGAFNSAVLGCQSIAILPEGMSRERFQWLSGIAGEVITTPGSESNVKEIFDKCRELSRERGDDIVIFNQFEEFGNYLWHYEITADAISWVMERALGKKGVLAAYVSSTGSAGTIAAGDRLKQTFPGVKIGAAEALQCPTLLMNGFGAHRIEGIGDKHVPWIHNVRNLDAVIAVDDHDCMNLLRLFNEPEGKALLSARGVPAPLIESLPLVGISGMGNLLASIKLARHFELSENDAVVTILTDSMQLYGSRVRELAEQEGPLDRPAAVRAMAVSLEGQRSDNVLELTHPERKRVHNLKYYTWVEQQGKTVQELNAQWSDPEYWERIQGQAARIDELIQEFNGDVGLEEKAGERAHGSRGT